MDVLFESRVVDLPNRVVCLRGNEVASVFTILETQEREAGHGALPAAFTTE